MQYEGWGRVLHSGFEVDGFPSTVYNPPAGSPKNAAALHEGNILNWMMDTAYVVTYGLQLLHAQSL